MAHQISGIVRFTEKKVNTKSTFWFMAGMEKNVVGVERQLIELDLVAVVHFSVRSVRKRIENDELTI